MSAPQLLTVIAALTWGTIVLAAVCLVTYITIVTILLARRVHGFLETRLGHGEDLVPPTLISNARCRRTPPLVGDPHRTPSTWIGV